MRRRREGEPARPRGRARSGGKAAAEAVASGQACVGSASRQAAPCGGGISTLRSAPLSAAREGAVFPGSTSDRSFCIQLHINKQTCLVEEKVEKV